MDNFFEWYTSECSPKGYPSEIVGGFLILHNGLKHEILTGQYSQNGWGKVGSEFYLGSDIKPVPAYLIIQYISFIERKVYSGEVYFDKDVLIPLFQKQLLSPLKNNASIHYNRILIGTAPHGIVSVWLYGDTNAVEVLQFQCEEEPDFKISNYVVGYKDLNDYCHRSLSDRSPDIIKSTNAVSATAIPSKWSDIYRQSVSWKLEFHLLGEIESFQIWFFNGESEYHYPVNKQKSFDIDRMPSQIKVNWIKDDGIRSLGFFTADERSIFSAFDEFKNAGNDTKLIVQLREYDDSIRAFLKTKDRVMEIKRQA